MDDIILDGKEKQKIIDLLKSTPFSKLEIHPHYFNKLKQPRHGISLTKAEEIYNQFGKIQLIFKREGINSYKYAVVCRFNKKLAYYLLFFLDENPKKLFNAYAGNNAEERLWKKFFSH